MGSTFRASLTLALMMASVAPLGGQAPTSRPSAAPARLASLKVGEDVRVISTGQYYEGRFERSTADSLYLAGSRIFIAAVDTVWALRAPPMPAMAAAGALGGVAMGLLVSMVESVCILDCGSKKQGLSGTRIAQGAAIGAVMGMLMSTTRYWRAIYP